MKKSSFSSYLQKSAFSDFTSAMVVFLVAIPLCLGIALACDAPLMSGVIAGIIGGIVVGSLGGSELGVSGPAAGLVTVVVAAMTAVGTFEAFLLVTALSGVFQFILGRLRAGILAYYVPSSVIKGMLAAIGIIIIMKEIPYVLGTELHKLDDLALFGKEGIPIGKAIMGTITNTSPGTVVIALISLVILVVWGLKAFEKYKFFRIIPGPLVVILLGVGLQLLFAQFFPALAIHPEQLVKIPTGGGVKSLIAFPDFAQILNKDVWIYALILCAVASVETLVVGEATDKLDPQKRITDMNRELSAQGVANFLSGMIGGLPLTQVIVRSSANVQSGGKTRGAAIMHGFLLLGAILVFPRLMNLIPLSSLAAILIMVGYKLIRPEIIKSMFAKGWNQFIPFVVTIIAILLTDLLVGIVIGLGVAIFLILLTNHRIPFSYHFDNSDHRTHIRMKLSEIVTFLNKGEILSTLQLIPDGAVLEIDGTRSKAIDPDVMEVFEDFLENSKHRDIKVEMIGFEEKVFKRFPAKSLRKKLLQPRKSLGIPTVQVDESSVVDTKE